MKQLGAHLVWVTTALLGAVALGFIALNRGESINALWIIIAAVCVFLIAYRYYSRFIAHTVLVLDPHRLTPAMKNNDGLDYVPTNKYVLFGHHFAAIAGAGPLVGPVLAAQLGYLPGMLWILAGVVFAGAVQDFMVLFVSMRNNGRSLGELIKSEMGKVPGMIALFGCFLIMVIILAVLALIVVKALTHSPWGTFTIAATIPIAVFMGIYMRYIRPGHIGEISIVGFILLMCAIYFGESVAHHPVWSTWFDLNGQQLTIALISYGAIAALIPIWLLSAPRDYLSTFMKIGTIVGLAVAVLFVAPDLKMPAVTQFVDGSGPVWSGSLFPFLFITIACGAVSGFHALIASGTTPKMLENEMHARFIGYGAMLMEAFVAIMALIAASAIDPGVYFAMNSPAAIIGETPESVAAVINSWGFAITPEVLVQTTHDIGESSILSRIGGAPTLAVGMAQILNQLIGGQGMMAFWYHFAILFEALFILTAVDAGTRAGRFMLHDLLGSFIPAFKRTDFLLAKLIATALCVLSWGYFLYRGVVDPYGGIHTLWPLFGIANQMLAALALMLCVVVLFKIKRQRYAWVAIIPATFLVITTLTAGWLKVVDSDPKVGFLSAAQKLSSALDAGIVLAPTHSIEEMRSLIFNNYLDAGLTLVFMAIVVIILGFSVRTALCSLKENHHLTDQETSDEMPRAVS
jgi:carbon starvation protein